MKEHALINILVDHSTPRTSPLYKEIPGEVIEANLVTKESVWKMFFDGTSRTRLGGKIIVGAEIVFVT